MERFATRQYDSNALKVFDIRYCFDTDAPVVENDLQRNAVVSA